MNKYWETNTIETIFKEKDLGFLYLRENQNVIKVYLDKILYIEGINDYIVIHRQNNIDLKIKLGIGEIKNMLPQHLFMRTHHSLIVALNKITSFTKNEEEIGKLAIPIGRNFIDVSKKL